MVCLASCQYYPCKRRYQILLDELLVGIRRKKGTFQLGRQLVGVQGNQMNLHSHPTDIAATLLNRSVCAVQVAAVLVDVCGVFSCGGNHAGADGLGQHAECHCINRSNPHRLEQATMYIAARRRRNKRIVTARPCAVCEKMIWGCKRVVYRDTNGVWCDYVSGILP